MSNDRLPTQTSISFFEKMRRLFGKGYDPVQTEDEAEKLATGIINEAQNKAEEIIADGKNEADKIIEEARKKVEDEVSEIQSNAYNQANEIIGQANTEAEGIIKQADTEAEEIIKNANTEAEGIIKNANNLAEKAMRDEEILKGADREANKIIEEARKKAEEIVEEAQKKAEEIKGNAEEQIKHEMESAKSAREKYIDAYNSMVGITKDTAPKINSKTKKATRTNIFFKEMLIREKEKLDLLLKECDLVDADETIKKKYIKGYTSRILGALFALVSHDDSIDQELKKDIVKKIKKAIEDEKIVKDDINPTDEKLKRKFFEGYIEAYYPGNVTESNIMYILDKTDRDVISYGAEINNALEAFLEGFQSSCILQIEQRSREIMSSNVYNSNLDYLRKYHGGVIYSPNLIQMLRNEGTIKAFQAKRENETLTSDNLKQEQNETSTSDNLKQEQNETPPSGDLQEKD